MPVKFLLFETGAHPLVRSRTDYVTQTGLKCAAFLLPQPPEGWDYGMSAMPPEGWDYGYERHA